MISVQSMFLPEDDKTSEQLSRNDALQQVGLNQSLLAGLAGPSINVGSLNGGLPLGYELGLGNTIPTSLQAQLLMQRSHLLNPLGLAGLSTSSRLPLVSNSSSLNALASGIQALQNNASLQGNAFLQGNASQEHPSKQRGRPNAAEIKEALATLAAATAPAGASSTAPQVPTPSEIQASLPVVVFMDCDEESLSDYQCLLRKQIELFEA